jgi:hypothetical protein
VFNGKVEPAAFDDFVILPARFSELNVGPNDAAIARFRAFRQTSLYFSCSSRDVPVHCSADMLLAPQECAIRFARQDYSLLRPLEHEGCKTSAQSLPLIKTPPAGQRFQGARKNLMIRIRERRSSASLDDPIKKPD